jgi:xanthine dehydrogenase accessory factor
MNRNAWITHAARLHDAQQPFALVTVLRVQAPTSAKVGDKALVTADGQIHGWIGGGCAQPAVVKTVRQALADGHPRTIRVAPSSESAERQLGDVLEFDMACHSGGTLELFIDPVLPAATLTIIGDSPVALALAGLAPGVGFRVRRVASKAGAGDHAGAAAVIDSDDATRACERFGSSAYVVVATQGRRDLEGLKAALALKPSHLWFVASARKAGVLRDSLLAAGEDADSVARIISPAGEPIGARTPEEIALSVLASIVAARRGRAPAHESQPVAATPVPGAHTASATGGPAVTAASPCCGAKDPAATAQAMAPAVPAAASPKRSCCGD